MATISDAQGHFHFLATPGETMLYCNDGKHNASIMEVTVPESDPMPLVTLKVEPLDKPQGYFGSTITMGHQVLKVNETQPVLAEGETPRAEPFGCYQQIIELQSESALPATAHWRVYHKDKPLESSFLNPMSGEITRTDKAIMILMTYQLGQTYSIELDLEGRQLLGAGRRRRAERHWRQPEDGPAQQDGDLSPHCPILLSLPIAGLDPDQ